MSLETRSSFILFLATILAAFGWVFSKETISALPPFGFIGLRFFCAAILLLPFCLSTLNKITKQDLMNAIFVGVLLGWALLMWIYAISISDSLGEGAFISSLSMLFVPLIAWLLFHETPPRIFWLSLPVAILGLAILSLGETSFRLSLSQIWFLISAIVLALHFNVNSRNSLRIPVLVLTCLQLFVVGLMAGCLSFFTEAWPSEIENRAWIWFSLSVLVATSLRYFMQTLGQKGCNPIQSALIMLMEPFWAVLLSVFLYQEQMPISKIIGCSLILLSLLIYRVGRGLCGY